MPAATPTTLTGLSMVYDSNDAAVATEIRFMREEQKEQKGQIAALRSSLEDKITRVTEKVENLSFVRNDIYQSEKAAVQKQVDSAHSLALAAISLSITVVMAFVGYLILGLMK